MGAAMERANKIMRLRSISAKLLAVCLLLAVVPLTLSTQWWYSIASDSLSQLAKQSLVGLADNKAHQVDTYMTTLEYCVETMAKQQALVAAVRDFQKALVNGTASSGPYKSVLARNSKQLDLYRSQYDPTSGFDFKDLLLVSTKGQILYEYLPENPIGTVLDERFTYDKMNAPGYFPHGYTSNLAHICSYASTVMATAVSDVREDKRGLPTAYMGCPVFDEGHLIGVVVVQLENQELNHVVDNYAGLGDTGETVIGELVAPDDAVIIAPLRHDPNATFQRHNVTDQPLISEDPNATSPLLLAIKGNRGSGIFTDYRHKKVLAAWRYLPFSRWGMLVKMDVDEALADVRNRVLVALVLAVVLAVVVTLITVAAAKLISDPITRLSQAALQIANGNLEVVLQDSDLHDEISELTRSFNKMTGDLKRKIAELAKTTAEKEKILSELRIARDIQLTILPKKGVVVPDSDFLEICGKMEAAEEVGGDLYDYFNVAPKKFGLVLGDVSGKGVPASLFMANTDAVIKATAKQILSPGACLEEVNRLLINEQFLFVTIFYGVLDGTTGELTFANGGHNPAYVIRVDGSVSKLPDCPGTALGIMPGIKFKEQVLQLTPGDTVVVYSDGVTEAFNSARKMYGEPRLEEFLRASAGLDPEQITDRLVAAVHAHADGYPQSDDITVLTLRYKG